MSKKEFEQLFHSLRKDRNRIIVKKHAFKDYPERGFSASEILDLVAGPGRLFDNNRPTDQSMILVISAFRRLKG